MKKQTLHLVFQTHWDREWYYPFETYRVRLVAVIDRIIRALDDNEIACFVLDGQTLPILDYLEVASVASKEAFLTLLRQGRIVVGPWYIAMDEFLVQGESIIRNLEIGEEIASRFGTNQRFGYLPDTFGHIGQMPQILKNFGIQEGMMWRGIDSKHSELFWEGIDGSRMFVVFLTEGYYQPLLNQKGFVADIQSYLAKIAPKATTSQLLLTTGGDHLAPLEHDLNKRIAALSETMADTEIKVSDFLGYVEAVKREANPQALEILQGELNSNRHCYILPNVWSTRSYLKITNQRLEDRLLKHIEPLMAVAYWDRDDAPLTYLTHIWKTVLENQPHDSICGCSVDAVHRENEMRSEKAEQMIDALQGRILNDAGIRSQWYYQQTAPSIENDDQIVSLFNPHPYAYSGIVQGRLFLHQANIVNAFELVAEHGGAFPVFIRETAPDRLFESPLDYPPFFRPGRNYDVAIAVRDLKPLSLTRCRIRPIPSDVNIDHEPVLENAFVKLRLMQDGSFEIQNKRSGVVYQGMNQWNSTLDAGDSYNYSKPLHDHCSIPVVVGDATTTRTSAMQSMRYHLRLTQPEGLTADRKEASFQRVETTAEMRVTLCEADSTIRIEAKIDQKAMDQRLRVLFPLKSIIATSTTDSAFELKTNVCNREEQIDATRGKEVMVAVDHSLSMHDIQDQGHVLRFFHRGLHEHQTVLRGDHTELEVTLVRSVSHLSRDDFRSRGGAAGPNLATPDAQVRRTLSIEYAFAIDHDELGPMETLRRANDIRHPAQIVRGHNLTLDRSLLVFDNEQVFLTSLRPLGKHQIEVRVWNPQSQSQTLNISSERSICSIHAVQINKVNPSPIGSCIALRAHEIKTLLIAFD